jgi:hypothetical protein
MPGHASISVFVFAIVPNSESFGDEFEDFVGRLHG